MADYVNFQRQVYSVHDPVDGYPDACEHADAMTWSITFSWDDTLAAEAQAEAERLASGGSPNGRRYEHFDGGFDNKGSEDMYLSGLETPKYWICGESDPNKYHDWHDSGNGAIRLGLFYQTGTGSYNTKSRIGVGMADTSSGTTWWVILISE